MDYAIHTGNPADQRTACVVAGIFDKRRLSPAAKALDKASEGQLTRTLKRGDMNGAIGDSLMLYDVPGVKAERVLLIGCGPQKELTPSHYRKAVAQAVGMLQGGHATNALLCLSELQPEGGDAYQTLLQTVTTAEDKVYRFDQLKSEAKPPKRPLRKLTLTLAEDGTRGAAKQAIAHGQAIAKGMNLARDLGNLPGNVCTPSYLADRARELAKPHKALKVQVLEEADMEKLGMGALLSVSRGSRQPAKLIVLEYRGGKPKAKPVVLVGKGLTFDAGGISLKPSEAMDEMKYDMCGGASVLGTLAACAEMGLPLNVVGIVPSSENLPDGAANKPGDIVTSMSGQTIEVLNTDAEGRLILCDALTYAERFEPDTVIDIATLTGACVVALGKIPSGLMTTDDGLAEEILQVAERSGDRAWRLPLWDDYQELLDSNFADMANIGGRYGGAITAGCFLARYTKKFKWAHLDIAGTAWKSGKEKGATGRPVPLLSQFLIGRAAAAPAARPVRGEE